jgi:hypothetical protein
VAGTLQISFDGKAVPDDFYDALSGLEIEENLDMPDAILLKLPVNLTDKGDLDYPSDPRVKAYANVTVVVKMDGKPAECIFDGYVLSHKLHLESGLSNSSLEVWGQDASWLMNLEEKVHEWSDVSDNDVAGQIFKANSITPASDNGNDDSPNHPESGHSLMQRGTDIQFLRALARRTGKICRVYCTDTAGQRTGWFAKPSMDGDPVVTLNLNDIENWTVESMDIEWDVTRPTRVKSGQALLSDSDPGAADTDVTDSGLKLLDSKGLSDFAGKAMTVMLAAPIDDAGELKIRAKAVLREAGWFVRVKTDVDASRIGRVLRAGQVIAIEQIGTLHSGKYLIWNVRHSLDEDSHTMKLTLVRNAVGAGNGGGGSGLAAAVAGALG